MINSENTVKSADFTGSAEHQSQSLDSLTTEEFLKVVGLRVRNQRSAMSMSRKKLAEVSGVSERYLAQLESGQGNMSIALLRKVTSAVDLSLATLLSAETPELNRQSDGSLQQKQPQTADSRHLSHGGGNRTFQVGGARPGNSNKLITEL